MAVRPVLVLPDKRLSVPAHPVAVVDEEARTLASDLIDTMRASPACVGLAATQIGVPVRAFAVDLTNHKKANTCHGEVIMFNPEVVVATGAVIGREGCMSVPDLTGNVARCETELVVRGLDLNGEQLVVHTQGFEARAFLHEIDHLDGLLFLDRVASPDAVFRRKSYK